MNRAATGQDIEKTRAEPVLTVGAASAEGAGKGAAASPLAAAEA